MAPPRPDTVDRPVLAGLMLPQLRMDPATIEQRARAAEDAGFHSVWFMDHLAPPGAPAHDSLEGWTVATAVATRTERLRIGHLVLCDAFRHPAVLAKMAATLDVWSGGRLILGLGWGSVPRELAIYGISGDPATQRAARLAESIEVLRAMFSGEPFDHRGAFFRLEGARGRPRPVQDPLPILIGGAGMRLTLPLVRRHAQWWNCPSYAADRLAELLPLVGDARISVQRPIGLAPSTAARDEVVALAERRFAGWGGLVAGTPDEVAAALQRDVDLGAELLICPFSDFGTPGTVRRFADEVLPALVRRSPS